MRDDGSLAGMAIGDDQLQAIGGIRSNGNMLPQPSLTVSEVYRFEGGDMVAIEVFPAFHPPVRYKGRCYIRVGPRKAIANEAEERRLSEKRTSTAKTYDARPFPNTTMDDLDAQLFKSIYLPQAIDGETLRANHRTTKEQLASLRLFDLVHDYPTNAGLLLLAYNPLYYLSGAYIQYVKLPGQEETSAIDYEKTFSGALITELRHIDEFVKSNIVKLKVIQKDSMREAHIYNYPLWTLRELVMNAIMHRDYESNAPVYMYEFSDRIEIINPGGLYGDVRRKNFPDVSDYRNPVIAEIMKTLGYVNRFNFGVKQAQKKLTENGSPPAEFDLDRMTKFKVTIKIHPNWL